MSPGDVVCLRKQVSNWGHIGHFPVEVLRINPKRVRVRTLDLKRNRDINVKAENLHALGATEYCRRDFHKPAGLHTSGERDK